MGQDTAGKMFAGSWKEFKKVIAILLLCCYVAFGQNCGGDHAATDSEQEITFPTGVDGPVVCQWILYTTELNSYIRLTVPTLVLPESEGCERHRIEVWSDGGISGDEEPKKLCGTGVGSWKYFFSTGRRMLIRFVSAGRLAGETVNFLLTYITEEEVGSRLIWTDQTLNDGPVRLHTLPADPDVYRSSGSITAKYYFQSDTAHWLALANDRRERSIFWSDTVNHRIIRGTIGRHAVGNAVYRDVSNEVQGLAVDWMAKNLYLTDALYNWILVMTYDASMVLHLVNTGLDLPRGIAVHPSRSYLFWTDCGNHPHIERSNLAGGERRVVIDTLLTSPNGITVDFQSQRIYWSNAGVLANSVESSLFDGGDRQTLFSVSSSGANFYHVTTFQDYVYVADREGHIRCGRKSIPGEEYFSLNLAAAIYGMTVYDTDSQPAVESPCSSNPCSYMCVGAAVEPYYKCLCPDDRLLFADARTCQEKTTIPSPSLFVAGATKLCQFPSNYPTMVIESDYNLTCFLTGRQRAVAMAVDVKDHMLFYSDVIIKKVFAVSLTADSKPIDITGVTRSVEGIAVDWISNNIYWTDNPAGKISVSTYDGQHQKEIITTDCIRPRAIAVEPFTKYLFWGEFGQPAQIERSDLDGSNRRIIVSDEISTPNGFTIDYSQQRLYYADSGTGAIEIVGYNGQDRVTLLQRQAPLTHNYFGMALFQDFILWTQYGQGNGIYVANRNTGEMVREHLITEEGVFGLTMYAEYTQPDGDGPCSVDNGGCNQLCLPSSTAIGGRVCYCTFGFILGGNSRTCISRVVEDNFVLFTDSFLKKVFQVDLTDSNYVPNGLPLGPMSNPIAVSYDPQERMVYWSDVVDNSINRAKLDGSDRQRIIYGNIQVPDGLTIDPVGRLLFWTDTGNSTISVATLTGQRQTTVISDGLENPRAIALHTEEGYMYWTDWGAEPKIERSFMDGSRRETLVNTDLGWPNGLTVDTQGRKLYWGEAQLNKIEVSDLNGQNRRLLIDFASDAHPYGIGIFGSHVYWTDWSEASLMKADKLTGENVVSVGPPGLLRPNELHIYDSDIPVQGHASCMRRNGHCAGICLPSSLGRTCHCGDQESLDDDGVSCSVGHDRSPGMFKCPLAFEEGELGDGCTGTTSDVCSVNCWTGFTNRVTSVICLVSGEWNEDLNTVCEEEYINEEPSDELTVNIYILAAATLTLNSRVVINCEVNDDSTEISWYKDGNLLPGSTIEDIFILGDALLILDFDYAHQGQYSCSAHRQRDGEMADAVLKVYLPEEELFDLVPENVTIPMYDNHVLPCIPHNRVHSVVWEKDGLLLQMNEHITDGIYDSLIFTDVGLEESGFYTCILMHRGQRVATASARVTVDSLFEVEEVCGTITRAGAVSTDGTVDGRIVGGHKAIRGSAPWMVRLYHRGKRQHFCGGSLVNNYWVITAAHCIRESGIQINNPENLMIRIGDYDTRVTDTSEILVTVEAIHLPEHYNDVTYDQDIALIKLANPIWEFTDFIRPICFPNITAARRMYKIGNKGKVTGWGQIAESGPYPRYMTEVSLPLVGKRRCKASTDELVTTNMFCAGYPRDSGDACRGDSGGPFSVEYRGRWYLLGIVSWGEGCGEDGKYGFYTKVAKFLDWTNGYINS